MTLRLSVAMCLTTGKDEEKKCETSLLLCVLCV